ncbi:hypothetical protein BN7_3566 [Wickerhamomyces ciferrii]|uniref:Protein kinase domain-containing protein n=1 Tax=Wickerhamomyces ciferrii (strain ATCC 14091 / BCRC 22168 / CBS 111 / JCM 3599 / NBRC 0793 / NRRL Y-1031 F-60-10) TaxID=1206466 RepID=K0KRQ7_WICCF|nr:uncharacterized protein BN7_3566 [Wickerhamomyces ciferrii]CCH44009.1 hypothetical protein BN7_3566 [Wickerhamomyces ciferrii]
MDEYKYNIDTITINNFMFFTRKFDSDDFFKKNSKRKDLNLINLETLGKINNHKWSQTININSDKFNKIIDKDIHNPDSINDQSESKPIEYILKIIDPEFFWLNFIKYGMKKGESLEPRLGYDIACKSYLNELVAFRDIGNYNKSCIDEEQMINIPTLVNFGIINMENPTHRVKDQESIYEPDEAKIPNHVFYFLMEKIHKTNHTITQNHIKSLKQQIHNLNHIVNIRHNDIRGDNIIISGEKAYLIDFGNCVLCRSKGKPMYQKIERSNDLKMLEDYIDRINEKIGN